MKHLFLAVALLITSCIASFASGSTKADNEAAMKQGRTELTAKIQELEQNLNNSNMQAAELSAKDVLKLMHKGMTQTRVELDLAKRDDQKAINARFLELEAAAHQFKTLSVNVTANGQKMLGQARSFMKKY